MVVSHYQPLAGRLGFERQEEYEIVNRTIIITVMMMRFLGADSKWRVTWPLECVQKCNHRAGKHTPLFPLSGLTYGQRFTANHDNRRNWAHLGVKNLLYEAALWAQRTFQKVDDTFHALHAILRTFSDQTEEYCSLGYATTLDVMP